jgi:hypothetical protein
MILNIIKIMQNNINDITLGIRFLDINDLNNLVNTIEKLKLNNNKIENITVYIIKEPLNNHCNVYLKKNTPWYKKTSYYCNIIIYDLCILHNKKQLFVSFTKPTNYEYTLMIIIKKKYIHK